jgi:hypothetical protein
MWKRSGDLPASGWFIRLWRIPALGTSSPIPSNLRLFHRLVQVESFSILPYPEIVQVLIAGFENRYFFIAG